MKKILFIMLLLVLLSSCDREGGERLSQKVGVSCRAVSSSLRKETVAHVNMLVLGETRSDVEKELGKPDKIDIAAGKRGLDFHGKMAYYILKDCGGGRVVYGDEFVRLYYDVNDHLIAIESVGVSGVSEKSVKGF